MRWCNIILFFPIGLISRLWTHNREYHPVFQLGNLHIRGVPVRVALGSGKPVDRTAATYFFQRWRCDINDRRSRSRFIAIFISHRVGLRMR